MPELPEAETIVRGLTPLLVGRTVAGVEVLRRDRAFPSGQAVEMGIPGRSLAAVQRRGKCIVLVLPLPEAGPLRLVVGLGMTGRLLWNPTRDLSRHPVLRILLDSSDPSGSDTLVFDDVRRFGSVRLMTPEAWLRWNRSLGAEPLGSTFTGAYLEAALKGSRRPVHTWLLDQGKVAGVGNIYANEALFHAGIHPATPASSVPGRQVAGLHRALRRVLRHAVRSGGTTLQDYRRADGSRGSFSSHLRVYGREGDPCPGCTTPVVRQLLGGRSVFHCPRCQPSPATLLS